MHMNIYCIVLFSKNIMLPAIWVFSCDIQGVICQGHDRKILFHSQLEKKGDFCGNSLKLFDTGSGNTNELPPLILNFGDLEIEERRTFLSPELAGPPVVTGLTRRKETRINQHFFSHTDLAIQHTVHCPILDEDR